MIYRYSIKSALFRHKDGRGGSFCRMTARAPLRARTLLDRLTIVVLAVMSVGVVVGEEDECSHEGVTFGA